jgi:hypothetical protein
MPGLAPEGPADLICEQLHIQGHRLSHASRSGYLFLYSKTSQPTTRLVIFRFLKRYYASVIVPQLSKRNANE